MIHYTGQDKTRKGLVILIDGVHTFCKLLVYSMYVTLAYDTFTALLCES
jgi:hypothetical protein